MKTDTEPKRSVTEMRTEIASIDRSLAMLANVDNQEEAIAELKRRKRSLAAKIGKAGGSKKKKG